MSDFHTLTYQHDSSVAIDVLHIGYHLHMLMYVFDKLLCLQEVAGR